MITNLISGSQTGEEMAMGLRDGCRVLLSHRKEVIQLQPCRRSPRANCPICLFVFTLSRPCTNKWDKWILCACALRCFDSCDIPEFSGGFWELGRTRLGLWIGMLGGLNEWQKSFTDDTYEWRIAWERWQGECVMKCFSWCGWGYICSGCVWPHLIVNRLVCVWSMLN